MDSPQSVVSPFKTYVACEIENPKTSSCISKEVEIKSKEAVECDLGIFIGVLDVYVHQARDIHNVCIYHKQDVYAKVCLASDPENAVSTQTINGGGKNPVFNQHLRLNIRRVDSSVKCELWMLSRVKNYLEDQLLGFALVPMSEVLMSNGKLEKEFSLSSSDVFHSPAGFVQLSLSYSGAPPEVISLPALPTALATDAAVPESVDSAASDFEKIEFPDLKIVNENRLMVSEYFGLPCSNMDTQNSESLITLDVDDHVISEMGVRLVESFSTDTANSVQAPNIDSPTSSVATNGIPSTPIPASSQSSETQGVAKPLNEEQSKEKCEDVGDGECDSSAGVQSETFPRSVPSVKVEPEQSIDKQDIVDMYMKSMQQFTESLAKMKLPIDSGTTSSGNSSTDEKLQASKNGGSRVFYGSRAFF